MDHIILPHIGAEHMPRLTLLYTAVIQIQRTYDAHRINLLMILETSVIHILCVPHRLFIFAFHCSTLPSNIFCINVVLISKEI